MASVSRECSEREGVQKMSRRMSGRAVIGRQHPHSLGAYGRLHAWDPSGENGFVRWSSWQRVIGRRRQTPLFQQMRRQRGRPKALDQGRFQISQPKSYNHNHTPFVIIRMHPPKAREMPASAKMLNSSTPVQKAPLVQPPPSKR